MRGRQSRIIKLTVPRLPKIVQRTRLYRWLDQALKNHTVVWINGPPGVGKTTLVASYLKHKKIRALWYQVDAGDTDVGTLFHYLTLAYQKLAPRSRRPLPKFTPEFLPGLLVFARTFFEQLFQSLKSPAVMVLDNYQEAGSHLPFHQLMEIAFREVPPGMSVIIISRQEPPNTFARLQLMQELTQMDEEALRLTLGETKEIVALFKKKGFAPLSTRDIQELYQRVGGWVAGVILTLQTRMRNASVSQPDMTQESSPQLVFELFANEIFRNFAPHLQTLLLRTAIFETFSVPVAQTFAQSQTAIADLDHLCRNRYFIERRGESGEYVYQYHPMFREFLRKVGRQRLSTGEWRKLHQRAGELLESAGETVMAIDRFQIGECHEAEIRLICQEAPKLMEQGRIQTLDRWIARLPEDQKHSNPWVQFWWAQSAFGVNMRDAVSRYETAFQEFRKTGDYNGMAMAWSGWVDSIAMQWMDLKRLDSLVGLYDEVIPAAHVFQDETVRNRVTFARLHARLWQQPDHHELKKLVTQCLSVFHLERNPNNLANQLFILGVYYMWKGTHRLILDLVEHVHQEVDSRAMTPYCRGMIALMKAQYFWFEADTKQMFHEAETVDQIIREAGIVGGQLQQNRSIKVHAAILMKDYELAQVVLEENDRILTHAPSTIRGYHHHQVGWVAWLQGDTFRAKEEVELALASAYELGGVFPIGLNHLCAAMVYDDLQLLDQAAEHLAKGMPHAQYMQSPLLLFMGHLVAAAIAYTRKDEAGGREALAQAMEWGRVYTFVEFPYFHPRWMARLCVYALEAGIEVEYVRYLIQRRDLVPETPPVHLEDWPWPVRISTLGTFAIEVRGQRVSFPRKMQKRTLAFLKALVCATQREVALETVLDWLWPESEGDHAYNALTTTIHRARKLIGDEQAIVIQDGKIGFNAQRVWVDSWAMKEQLVRADEAAARGETATAEQWLTRAVQQYRGSFLPEDEAEPWTTAMREKLRRQYGQALAKLTQEWARDGKPEEAVRLLERAIEQEPGEERWYQDLMRMLGELGRSDEVQRVYEQCGQTLAHTDHRSPSLDTTTLRDRWVKGSSQTQ
ncbi:BTAD domain-containing putative transcriptional regulator [Candidatus Nitronereus thalassa]|uniref:BTAD domain-containing putative transcriptional regulator n=1 Tax=Candidatus Nitronereus thalassa TaxID=3020898 RepID=A0ABU3K491_9BACT|nr:BTAD domain-containing putative transcriptional regulator [Candidatus Nitronereus thalassa]MDT7041220.1 BTAD domain-containing putative transcriptional regulator [Candidatus Nitronereus thalassa]